MKLPILAVVNMVLGLSAAFAGSSPYYEVEGKIMSWNESAVVLVVQDSWVEVPRHRISPRIELEEGMHVTAFLKTPTEMKYIKKGRIKKTS